MSKVNDETPSIRTASEVNQKNKDYWQPSWGPQPESDDQQRNPTGVARDIEYKGLDADGAYERGEKSAPLGQASRGAATAAKKVNAVMNAQKQANASMAKAGAKELKVKGYDSPTGLGEAGEHEGMVQDAEDSTPRERELGKRANTGKISQAIHSSTRKAIAGALASTHKKEGAGGAREHHARIKKAFTPGS